MDATPAKRLTALYRRHGIEAEFTALPCAGQFTVLVAREHAARCRRELARFPERAGFRFVKAVEYDADEDCPAETLLVYEVAK